MYATAPFRVSFNRVSDSRVETTGWVLSRQMLQRIATRLSLVGEAIGFSMLGILIIMNRHQADLNGLAGGSSVAMIGGISAVLVASVFLFSALLHWRYCARHPAAMPARHQSFRFTFARPNPLTASALLSA